MLGLFPQGRHHPTALFVLRSLVPLVGEESVGGKFRGTGVKLTQLVPGGDVVVVVGGWGWGSMLVGASGDLLGGDM